MTHKYSVVAQARWEDDDVCEWIEYNRLIGFDHIYLYSNDDEPFSIVSRIAPYLYGQDPFVTLIHWPKKAQQFLIYLDFLQRYLMDSTWVTFLDVDEFVVLKQDKCVANLISRLEVNFDSINLNWVIYGNNKRTVRDPSLDVLLSYTRRNKSPNIHTKNITRSSSINVGKIRFAFDQNALGFWHFWDRYPFPSMRICNVLGEDVRGYTKDFPNAALEIMRNPNLCRNVMSCGYIAHFQIKSEADYQRRVLRGGSENMKYFGKIFDDGTYKVSLAASNEVEDNFLASLWLDHIRPLKTLASYGYVPKPKYENVALWCPTSQSSYVEGQQGVSGDHQEGWTRDHANNGFQSGRPGFKTAYETDPWWQLDLLAVKLIHEVHVYNCFREKLREQLPEHKFELSSSLDEWTLIHFNGTGQTFGGIDGEPLIIKLPSPVQARYLRIMASGNISLKLDEVEIYGE